MADWFSLPRFFPGVVTYPRSLFAFGEHAMSGVGEEISALPAGLKAGHWYLPDVLLMEHLPAGPIGAWR
jgi:hypothetical protein